MHLSYWWRLGWCNHYLNLCIIFFQIFINCDWSLNVCYIFCECLSFNNMYLGNRWYFLLCLVSLIQRINCYLRSFNVCYILSKWLCFNNMSFGHRWNISCRKQSILRAIYFIQCFIKCFRSLNACYIFCEWLCFNYVSFCNRWNL